MKKVAAFFIFCFFVLSACNSSENELLQQETAYWFERDKLFEGLPMDSNAIVFVGDSHIQFFELAEFFENPHVKNRGIMGDNVKGILNRIDPVINSSPKKLFIEIGINDVLAGVNEETIVQHYSQLVTALKKRIPGAQIYVQSLLPVTKSSAMQGRDIVKVNTAVRSVNSRLKKLAEENNLIFIDLYNAFALNDELNPAYTFDGLHLDAKGYFLWAKLLKPFVDD